MIDERENDDLPATLRALKKVRLTFDLLLAITTFNGRGYVTKEKALELFGDMAEHSEEIRGCIHEFCDVIGHYPVDPDAEERAMHAYNTVTTYWRLAQAHLLVRDEKGAS